MSEGRYRYLEKIGEGGMATVYRGIQNSLSREVAIKVLNATLSNTSAVIKRFERESLIIARLNHPNIIHVIDRGTTSKGRPVFVMEYVEGENLADAIHSSKFTFNDQVDIAVQVCKGLAYAHKLDVIHRDIKPANVIVDNEGHARLLDFGIASFFESSDKEQDEARLMLGTESYMAPEQRKGIAATTKRSDIYSLGILIFELFTGRLPGTNPKQELVALPKMPPALVSLIVQCMAYEESARPGSVEEVKTRLLQSMKGGHIDKAAAGRAVEGMSSIASKFGLLDVMREDKFGALYLYEDKVSSRLLVIKKMMNTERGYKESKLLSSLDIPHSVKILGVSKKDKLFIVVMDYVSGGSLQDLLVERISFNQFLPMAIQMAKGIAAAHKNRLVHGNLRPSNVLLDEQRHVRLSDFGLDEHYRLHSEDRNWYSDGRRDIDELSDIFAMGAIFYHSLTLFPPEFKDGRLVKSKYFMELPNEVQQLIERMLAKDLSRRPQSAESVVSELLPFIEDEQTLIREEEPKSERIIERIVQYRYRKRWIYFLACSLILSLGLNAALLSGHQENVFELYDQISGYLGGVKPD